MKKLAIGILALAGVMISVPANAQVSFSFGTGGPGYGYYGGPRYGYDAPRYYDPAPYYRPRYAYGYGYSRCRTVRVWRYDHYRLVRRCW